MVRCFRGFSFYGPPTSETSAKILISIVLFGLISEKCYGASDMHDASPGVRPVASGECLGRGAFRQLYVQAPSPYVTVIVTVKTRPKVGVGGF